ncbi:double zinc ribbon domain-containing protein [Natronosalvus rutilus]|uniref:Zinc ribbon domain-containing protein n=1 Tax=Natronosalvus rutilus TaxID=2953753 RepID=A0A9E7NBN8_9EURY|nr:zinc ribbon domain-containing protein [Natronosalvus rutilus]UTF54945.1 zinc ribbon domain-containing protein [Natronosalvus rutilus]
MGKITFRADDDLVAELEAFDASKSEVMREALRAYLDEQPTDGVDARPTDDARADAPDDSLDALLEERIDSLLERRLSARHSSSGQDVNVSIALEGVEATRARETESTTPAVETHAVDHSSASNGSTRDQPARSMEDRPARGASACGQCGTGLESEHVFCPNCGEKATHRVFCDCGDEVRSDWAFCPSCGRRTPAADVLESNQS